MLLHFFALLDGCFDNFWTSSVILFQLINNFYNFPLHLIITTYHSEILISAYGLLIILNLKNSLTYRNFWLNVVRDIVGSKLFLNALLFNIFLKFSMDWKIFKFLYKKSLRSKSIGKRTWKKSKRKKFPWKMFIPRDICCASKSSTIMCPL